MNLQQLEYIVAIDTYRHFARAAEACFVTQATLSMMVKKLEEELGVQLFDRSKQPVSVTLAGEIIIPQARKVLAEASRLKEMPMGLKNEIKGEIRLGIIPTLAPYLLPRFLAEFMNAYPDISLKLVEISTAEILEQLQKDQLDLGLMATPLNQTEFTEEVLFYEPFDVFVSKEEQVLKKNYLLPGDLDINRLWLLEEGHCLRSQMVNLCELQKKELNRSLHYEAGSIESLIRIVEVNKGITIIPRLASLDLASERKHQVRSFSSPEPVREISLVSYRPFVKQKLREVLRDQIRELSGKWMQVSESKKVIAI
ncbi:MAG: LysR substrate-binding domain-containing protein [Bacteroidia bacterium]|nr:LysR substrate-binding domain-containing protein [Bacteroidia bacterium]